MKSLVVTTLFITLISFLTLLAVVPNVIKSSESGLYIVVTFPNLKYDVELITCKDDTVVWIAPPGVDPHSYQLTPKNVIDLKKADVIISSAHVPFELEIRDLVQRGEIKGILIEIPRIPDIKILKNPATGEFNFHMPIYDPYNYKIFLRHITSIFSQLRPDRAKTYEKNLNKVLKEIDYIIEKTPKLNVTAVIDAPPLQYAISWLGVNVKYVLIKEHGVPATPKDIDRIESAMASGEIQLAAVQNPPPSLSSIILHDMAQKYGIPIIYAPPPSLTNSTLTKLRYISRQVLVMKFIEHHRIVISRTHIKWILTMLSAGITYGFLGPVIAVRKLRFLSTAASHAALLAVAMAIVATNTLHALNEYVWAVIFSLLLIYVVGYMIYKGISPDTATSIFVSLSASASVLMMYFVLTRYSVGVNLWAFILGDPLLARWTDVIFGLIIATVTAIAIILTYKENICIGISRDCALISGIKVAFYDWLIYTLIGLASIAMIRIVGFILEHVLLLLPAAIAILFSRSAKMVLNLSVAISITSSLLGLVLGIILNQAPSGITGIILLLIYGIFIILMRRGVK